MPTVGACACTTLIGVVVRAGADERRRASTGSREVLSARCAALYNLCVSGGARGARVKQLLQCGSATAAHMAVHQAAHMQVGCTTYPAIMQQCTLGAVERLIA